MWWIVGVILMCLLGNLFFWAMCRMAAQFDEDEQR